MTDLPLSAWRPVVTGGAGFIGSTLTRHLVSQGARVTVLDAMVDGSGANAHNLQDIRDDVRFLELDLASAADVTDEISDATHIFHLAAQIGHAASMENPIEDLEANAKATLRLLDEVRHAANDPAFVFTSTRQVYGRPQTLPVGRRPWYNSNARTIPNNWLRYQVQEPVTTTFEFSHLSRAAAVARRMSPGEHT